MMRIHLTLLGRLGGRGSATSEYRAACEEKPAEAACIAGPDRGQPRTLVMLYRVLAEGPEGDAQRDIEQLLDLYTPLIQSPLRGDGASRSQQVVDAMAITGIR